MRINPLRVELTVPAQHMAAVAVGRAVSFSIDAYPGQTFTGPVRYVSPGRAHRLARAGRGSRRAESTKAR